MTEPTKEGVAGRKERVERLEEEVGINRPAYEDRWLEIRRRGPDYVIEHTGSNPNYTEVLVTPPNDLHAVLEEWL